MQFKAQTSAAAPAVLMLVSKKKKMNVTYQFLYTYKCQW